MSLDVVFAHYGVEVNPNKRTQLTLCPLDHETHPSCAVNLDKQLWHCHSCGEGGDAISLIRKKEGYGFAPAKRKLAEVAGSGDEPLPTARRSSGGLSAGKGFRPRYRRAVSPRRGD